MGGTTVPNRSQREFKILANIVDHDEAAHYRPYHPDLLSKPTRFHNLEAAQNSSTQMFSSNIFIVFT